MCPHAWRDNSRKIIKIPKGEEEMTRKSPIKHHVRQHRRKGRPVRDYERGHGSRPNKIAQPRLRHSNQQSNSAYAVEIMYEALPSETIPVSAANYPDAIEMAMSSRREITSPWKIDVRRLKS
jgi:hypothetical protein